MYFLDTNVIIDVVRGKSPELERHFRYSHITDIAIPSIVIAELEYGAWHSGKYEENRRQFLPFTRNFRVIPFNENEAEVYGAIRQQLAAKGSIIGPNDLLIAATAIANDAILVTHNVKEFERIDNLRIEDWTQ